MPLTRGRKPSTARGQLRMTSLLRGARDSAGLGGESPPLFRNQTHADRLPGVGGRKNAGPFMPR